MVLWKDSLDFVGIVKQKDVDGDDGGLGMNEHIDEIIAAHEEEGPYHGIASRD